MTEEKKAKISLVPELLPEDQEFLPSHVIEKLSKDGYVLVELSSISQAIYHEACQAAQKFFLEGENTNEKQKYKNSAKAGYKKNKVKERFLYRRTLYNESSEMIVKMNQLYTRLSTIAKASTLQLLHTLPYTPSELSTFHSTYLQSHSSPPSSPIPSSFDVIALRNTLLQDIQSSHIPDPNNASTDQSVLNFYHYYNSSLPVPIASSELKCDDSSQTCPHSSPQGETPTAVSLSNDSLAQPFNAFNPYASRVVHDPKDGGAPYTCATHIDPGFLTVLGVSDVKGLELFDKGSGEWFAPEEKEYGLVPGKHFFLLVGESIERASGKRIPGCVHRVLNKTPGQKRFNCAFELRPNIPIYHPFLSSQEVSDRKVI